MRIVKALAAIATVALFSGVVSASAQAQETAKWGTSGPWGIYVDRSVGNGCYAAAAYESGLVVRMGIDRKSGTINLLLGKDAWQTAEVGKEHRLKFVFDGYDPYIGTATTSELLSGYKVLKVKVTANFAEAFMKKNVADIYINDKFITKVNLRGTYAAMAEVLECQQQMDAAKATPNVSQPAASNNTASRPQRF